MLNTSELSGVDLKEGYQNKNGGMIFRRFSISF